MWGTFGPIGAVRGYSLKPTIHSPASHAWWAEPWMGLGGPQRAIWKGQEVISGIPLSLDRLTMKPSKIHQNILRSPSSCQTMSLPAASFIHWPSAGVNTRWSLLFLRLLSAPPCFLSPAPIGGTWRRWILPTDGAVHSPDYYAQPKVPRMGRPTICLAEP